MSPVYWDFTSKSFHACAARNATNARSIDALVSLAERLTVLAPAGMTTCVVNNLLANAVNFTDRGRIDVRIGRGAPIAKDSGVGIPATDHARIFEPR
jgi:signal transduction histidine kinase